MIEIKLCGLKEPSHIEVAFNLGIKYVGLVLYNKSPRYLNRETARSLISNSPPGIKKVGLVVDPTNDFLDKISDIFSYDSKEIFLFFFIIFFIYK